MPKYDKKSSSDGMQMQVKSLQKPESCYSQSFGDKTLRYTEDKQKEMSKEAGKLRAQKHEGRY